MMNEIANMEVESDNDNEENVTDKDETGSESEERKNMKNNTDSDPQPESDSTSKGRPSNLSDINEERWSREFKDARKHSKSEMPRLREEVFEKAEEVKKHEEEEGDFLSKVMGFFTSNSVIDSKQQTMDDETPLGIENDNDSDTWEGYYTKDDLLYDIDEKAREECVKMIRYYQPSSTGREFKKIEKHLPTFIEMDAPLPEELSMDYEFAKYDISGLLALPTDIPEEYENTLIKHQTLS